MIWILDPVFLVRGSNLILDPVCGFGPFQDNGLEDSRGQITLSKILLCLFKRTIEKRLSALATDKISTFR